MFRSIFTIFSLINIVVMAQTCPLKCPSCTKCDAKRGTCTLPRDYVSCFTKTKPALPGYCYAGICNSQLSLSPLVSLKSCQRYSCIGNTCTLKSEVDGADCSVIGAALHSICVSGVCKPVVIGLSDAFPFQNIGCIGLPNGTPCDTNDVLHDGETCVNNICKFPDGSYYGYIPVTV